MSEESKQHTDNLNGLPEWLSQAGAESLLYVSHQLERSPRTVFNWHSFYNSGKLRWWPKDLSIYRTVGDNIAWNNDKGPDWSRYFLNPGASKALIEARSRIYRKTPNPSFREKALQQKVNDLSKKYDRLMEALGEAS
jgi:hypothetical protein